MNMRLIGAAKVSDLSPGMVDTRGLSMHTTTVPSDTLGLSNYDPLVGPREQAQPKSKL